MDKKSCFIFDLDGTVYLGNKPIPGTIDFIQRNLGVREIFFLTNNTSKNLDDYITKLAGFGIHIGIERMLSPLLPLVDYLIEEGITHIYPVGNSNFIRFIKERMPSVVFTDGDDCRAVVLGFDTELTYAKLEASCLLLQDPKVQFLATHADAVCPSPRGPLPDAGSFIALYETATGRTPDVVFGKPNTILLKSLLRQFTPEQMVMVGDRIYTDKILAENAGMDFILVLSGETRREDLATLERQPTLVLDDLGSL